MKKVYKVMSSVALAGMILSGVAWGTAQAATQPSAKAQSAVSGHATQEGVTLSVAKALYDGNHVRIELKRSGKGFDGKLVGGEIDEKTGDYLLGKGSISNIKMAINGKSINEYGGGDHAKRPTLVWGPKGNDTAIIYLTDASQLGGNLEAFPDKFQLTAEIDLEGHKKPFKLKIPVQKTAEKPVVVKPNVTKASGNVTLKLNKATLTSTSSRLQLIMEGYKQHPEANQDILFDFVDDQGHIIERISGSGTDENNTKGDMYYDFVLEAVGKSAKSITVKPFKPVTIDDGSGRFEVDANGEIVKQYIKELEMTVSVKK